MSKRKEKDGRPPEDGNGAYPGESGGNVLQTRRIPEGFATVLYQKTYIDWEDPARSSRPGSIWKGDGETMRYFRVSEEEGWLGKLYIGFVFFFLLLMAAVILGMVLFGFLIPGEFSHPLFPYLAAAAWGAVSIHFFRFAVWELSSYRLCPEGIVVKSLFITRAIPWSRIQSISIYTFYYGRTTEKDYITVHLEGGEGPRELELEQAFAKRKYLFLARYSEERREEFEQYWPHEIRRGRQEGRRPL